jgi:hypothetical protein
MRHPIFSRVLAKDEGGRGGGGGGGLPQMGVTHCRGEAATPMFERFKLLLPMYSAHSLLHLAMLHKFNRIRIFKGRTFCM